MTIVLPLPTLGLHLVPFLLLVRVQHCADLRVSRLADVHHLGVSILLGKRTILVQALHLRMLGLQRLLHLGLLIGSQIKLLRQFRCALGWVGRTVVPAAVILGSGRWLIVGLT